MRKLHLNLSLKMIEGCAIAVGLVLGLTALFLVIGRNVLGEGVIALLYLVPIGWSTTRWGQLAGMCAAVTAFSDVQLLLHPAVLHVSDRKRGRLADAHHLSGGGDGHRGPHSVRFAAGARARA